MIRASLVALTLVAVPLPALAHKVIASVFAGGDVIEGEIGFSNGTFAVNHTVEIYDHDGNKLGEAVTDEEGYFTYRPTQPVTHIFHADLGAGHVANLEMEAAEVAAILGTPAAPPKPGNPSLVPESGPLASTTPAPQTDQRALIAEVVRDEMRPLRREIAAYKEKNDLQTILGGIGYIVGIFGFGFYLAARRKLDES